MRNEDNITTQRLLALESPMPKLGLFIQVPDFYYGFTNVLDLQRNTYHTCIL
jgi:hypothetical protein